MAEITRDIKQYSDFSRQIYESMGLPISYEQVRQQIGKIAKALVDHHEQDPGQEWFNANTMYDVREEPWLIADKAEQPSIKAITAIDSMAIPSSTRWWPTIRVRRAKISDPRVPYQITQLSGKDLIRVAEKTQDRTLLLDTLGAVASGFRELGSTGYIPSSFTQWPVNISRLDGISGDDIENITSAMDGIDFTDEPTDSEESDDYFPIQGFIDQDNVPIEVKKKLLELAQHNVNTTSYKTWVWRARLKNTLYKIANSPKDPLRFKAREDLKLPIDDKEYSTYIRQKRAQADAKRKRKAQSLGVIDEANAIIREAQLKTIRTKILKALMPKSADEAEN